MITTRQARSIIAEGEDFPIASGFTAGPDGVDFILFHSCLEKLQSHE